MVRAQQKTIQRKKKKIFNLGDMMPPSFSLYLTYSNKKAKIVIMMLMNLLSWSALKQKLPIKNDNTL